MQTLVIELIENTNSTNKRVAKFKCVGKIWQNLRKKASAKFLPGKKKRIRRLFMCATGEELTPENTLELLTHLHNCAPNRFIQIAVSYGEEFNSGSVERSLVMQKCVNSAHTSLLVDRAVISHTNADSLLRKVSEEESIHAVIGLPNFYAGQNQPHGLVIAGNSILPRYLGSLHCGVSLVQTNLRAKDTKRQGKSWKRIDLSRDLGPERALEALTRQGVSWPDNVPPFDLTPFEDMGIDATLHFGLDNFIELVRIHRVLEPELLFSCGIDTTTLLLLVHSSTGKISSELEHISERSLSPGTDEFDTWLECYEQLSHFGKRNRSELSIRFLDCLKSEGQIVLDHVHNSVRKELCGICVEADTGSISGEYRRHSETCFVMETENEEFTFTLESREITLEVGSEIIVDGQRGRLERFIQKTGRWRIQLEDCSIAKYSNAELQTHQELVWHLKRDSELIVRSTSGCALWDASWMFPDGSPAELSISPVELFVHRRNASNADDLSPRIILGSRGGYSYLVQPLPGCSKSLFSIPDGAGRRFSKHQALQRGRKKWYGHTASHSKQADPVVCISSEDDFHKTAPQAYKRIDDVIADLETFEMIKVIATLEPLLHYRSLARKR